MRYSPKVDLVFRKLFGSDENKDLLLSLINSVLDSQPLLTDLTIKNPYNLATYVGSKTSILDIKAVDTEGTWYDVELQIGEYGFYGKRALYYLSKMYVDQLEQGQGYSSLNKTIGIHLIDFDYFGDTRYRRHFVFKDMETNEHIEHLSYQQLYFIEMSKFRLEGSALVTLLDRWIAFLNTGDRLSPDSIPAPLRSEPEIVKAVDRLNVMGLDGRELEIYEAELKAQLDEKERLRTAEEKALARGHEAGIARGMEQGQAIGMARGEEIGLVRGEEIGLARGEEIGLARGEAIGEAKGFEVGLQHALEKLIASGIAEADARKLLGLPGTE